MNYPCSHCGQSEADCLATLDTARVYCCDWCHLDVHWLGVPVDGPHHPRQQPATEAGEL